MECMHLSTTSFFATFAFQAIPSVSPPTELNWMATRDRAFSVVVPSPLPGAYLMFLLVRQLKYLFLPKFLIEKSPIFS